MVALVREPAAVIAGNMERASILSSGFGAHDDLANGKSLEHPMHFKFVGPLSETHHSLSRAQRCSGCASVAGRDKSDYFVQKDRPHGLDFADAWPDNLCGLPRHSHILISGPQVKVGSTP